ncbi:hypothetical protein HD554DRAFT_1993899, partial [Boletus coccyginus]
RQDDTPTTLTHTQVLDPDIDPLLYTPSKRMHLMTAVMAHTSLGSFLVGQDPITSASHITHPVLEKPPTIPHPDWFLLRIPAPQSKILYNAKHHIQSHDLIIEAAHAQMIMQELFVKKQ